MLLIFVDTECLYTQETQKIVSRYGKTFDWTLKAKLMGRKPLDGAKILVDELQIPLTPAQFQTELYGNLMDKFPDAPFLPCTYVESVVITDIVQYIYSRVSL